RPADDRDPKRSKLRRHPVLVTDAVAARCLALRLRRLGGRRRRGGCRVRPPAVDARANEPRPLTQILWRFLVVDDLAIKFPGGREIVLPERRKAENFAGAMAPAIAGLGKVADARGQIGDARRVGEEKRRANAGKVADKDRGASAGPNC